MANLWSTGWLVVTALFALSLNVVTSVNHGVQDAEWLAYKDKFGKDYTNSAVSEAYAHYYYTYNKRVIDNHNNYYRRGLRTFGLRVNQFTDMRLVSFNALFPVVTQPTTDNAGDLPIVDQTPPATFDPVDDYGFNITSQSQGTVCNSGWAYAAAKAIELWKAYEMGNMNSEPLSAQNFIDCAGQSRGCTNQVPQAAFDYLSVYQQELHLASAYNNTPMQAQPGMCVTTQNPTGSSATLQRYARLKDGDDAALRRYVPTNPVVIEFNPTSFEFMHYGEGIFQQPATYRGSHFMTVTGYGTNSTSNLNYFILQNSFGPDWGEDGAIRIAYSDRTPLTKSAILPAA